MKGPSVIDTDRAIWDAMLAHLRAHNPTICRQWFEELSPLGVGGGALQLRTLSSLHRDYLRRQCADAFNDAARTVSGRLLSVRFLGPEDAVIAPPPVPSRKGGAASRPAEAEPLPHRPEPAPREAPHTNGHSPDRERTTPDVAGRASQEAVPRPMSDDHAPGRRHARLDPASARDVDAPEPAEARHTVDPSRDDDRPGHAGADGPATAAPPPRQGEEPRRIDPPLVVIPARAPLPSPSQGSSLAPTPTPTLGPTLSASHAPPQDRVADRGAQRSEPYQPEPYPPEPARPARSWAGPAPHRYESLVVNPDNAFDTFVVGPGNRLAHAAAMAVVSNPGRVYNPFFVHGGVGLGKTHLLQAVCLRLVEANPRLVLYYTSCENFVTQYVESVQSGEMSEFRHRFRDVDVLVIDDIHFLTKRDQSQEEFFHTFNSLYQAHKQIILSSDAPPEDIPQLEDRLVSRFKWGLVAKIEPPSYETRVEILKTKARLRGLEMPAAVAEYIAGRLDTNIRELEGAVVKLQIQAVVEKRPIDLDLARAALGDVPAPVVGEPTIQSIIDAVTEHYSIRLADLQSKHRQRSIALPRQVCMFLARRCTRHSLEEIGGFFGGRDHTTVMHAIRTVEERRTTDAEFENVLRVLEERVRASKQ